jgi:HSP20 family protein
MLNTRFFNEFDELRRSLDRLTENSWWSQPGSNGGNGSDWTFAPSIETGWTDQHLNLRFVMPAVAEKDVDVTIQGNQLLVKGERRAPTDFGNEGQIYNRLPYGKFERAVDLPNGLDRDGMKAQLHHGVLDVRIPIAEAMKPRKIPISAGSKAKAISA